MATGQDIDGRFDKALRSYLRKQRASETACPDPAVVAAYFEQSLDEAEARELEQHFARCPSCQSELALLARLEDPATGVPAHHSPPHEAAVATVAGHDKDPVKVHPAYARPAVELRREQLEPITQAAELDATGAENEHGVVRPSDEPPRFEHVRHRSWRWVAPTALAATAVIAVSVTYRFALDETSRRALEPTADRRANASAPAKVEQKQAPPAGVVEEPRARMEPPNAPPQRLDELAKSEAAPAAQTPAYPKPVAPAAPQAGADAGVAGGAVAPAPPSAEKKDAGAFAAKPSADASSAPAAARAKAAMPSLQDLAQNAPGPSDALRDNELDAGEKRAAASTSAARAEAPLSAIGGVTAGHGVIVITSPANPLLEWRFSGTAIERSDDGGRTWQPQQSPAPAAILAASAANGRVCWAVGKSGTVIRTLDGRNWQVLEPLTTADLVEVSASNESSVTVKSSDGHRFSTTDGAVTWSAENEADFDYPQR
jgi:hypothetical protein